MLIYPAIDLMGGQAVRLLKGDYEKKTVYSQDPLSVALDLKKKGAEQIHIVDLDGAKSGETPNMETILKIKEKTGLFCEVGGGVRSMETVERYLACGIDRVILGTAAVTDEGFAEEAVERYGDRIAVGIDIKDGYVAVKGWTESSGIRAMDFCSRMEAIGVSAVICTDISKDGAMEGINRELYRWLSECYFFRTIASGGVSSLDDVKALKELGIYGAIIGKAYYTGALSLEDAIEAAL